VLAPSLSGSSRSIPVASSKTFPVLRHYRQCGSDSALHYTSVISAESHPLLLLRCHRRNNGSHHAQIAIGIEFVHDYWHKCSCNAEYIILDVLRF
jgi:hypothetical protein